MLRPSRMSQDPRILNVTRNFRLKRSQAERAVREGACVWVEYGVSVRSATIAESIAYRNEQARVREPLANAEIPGLVFEIPPSAVLDLRKRLDLIRAANDFVSQAG
jgi:hypothetical protein